MKNGIEFIKDNEGYSQNIYIDSRGYPTVGYGHCLDSSRTYRSVQEYHDAQFLKDYMTAERGVHMLGLNLDPVRYAAVVDLVYNLGFTKFSKFTHTIEALRKQDWESAAAHLKDSNWYHQVGRRAERVINLIRTGSWDSI